ncbi:hypothetical protein LCGC14_1270010 [marine sediment metagenome]|uniref:Phage head morphogenesis domain-containing protein n=1 Tax=marine sediment metagenome TaxID=412755 RepID=A0A0F9LJD3_9ZZZZ
MEKGLTEFQANVRAGVRGLWTGVFNLDQFISQMNGAIRRGFTQAWAEGAKECGILPDEITIAEQTKLNSLISTNLGFVRDFGVAIRRGSKANGGLLRTQMTRSGVWVSRYTQVVQEAKAMSCADQKLKWNIDPTKDNCSSCLKLNGKVKRASVWEEAGIIPQVAGAGYLICNGYRCGCTLDPTEERGTPGPFPRLP